MALPNTSWLYNNTSNDGVNSGNASGGAGASSSNWVVLDLTNDMLLFLDGQQVDEGSNSGLRYPLIIPDAGSIEAPKTFVDDDSAGIFDQVPLAGTTDGGQSGGNTQFVFAIYFDGATAGIPTLEAWNNETHALANNVFLGNGTPADSTLRAIATTDATPGSAWAGTPLSGTDSRINLDTAHISAAKNLYFNIKQIIQSTFPAQSNRDIVLTLRFLYS